MWCLRQSRLTQPCGTQQAAINLSNIFLSISIGKEDHEKFAFTSGMSSNIDLVLHLDHINPPTLHPMTWTIWASHKASPYHTDDIMVIVQDEQEMASTLETGGGT